MKPPKTEPTPAEEPKAIIVGVEILADALNVTTRRVQQFKKDGVFKDSARGQYDLIECTRAYIRFLIESYKRPESATNISSEKLRGMKIENDEREVKLAELLGELIPLETAVELLESVIVAARARILSASRRIKQQIVEDNNPQKSANAIDERFREILFELAAIEPRTLRDSKKATAIPTARKADRKPVGGQVPKT